MAVAFLFKKLPLVTLTFSVNRRVQPLSPFLFRFRQPKSSSIKSTHPYSFSRNFTFLLPLSNRLLSISFSPAAAIPFLHALQSNRRYPRSSHPSVVFVLVSSSSHRGGFVTVGLAVFASSSPPYRGELGRAVPVF